jgi:hypothetical protein
MIGPINSDLSCGGSVVGLLRLAPAGFLALALRVGFHQPTEAAAARWRGERVGKQLGRRTEI